MTDDDLPLPWKLQKLEREIRGIAIDSPGPREKLFELADKLAAIRCPSCRMPAPALIRPPRRFRPAIPVARVAAFVAALVMLALVATLEYRRDKMLTNRLDTFAAEQRQADAERHEQITLELRRIRSGGTVRPNSRTGELKPPGRLPPPPEK